MHWKRVALIHYWLVGMRGGERVLERLLHIFPQADIFTHVYAPESVSAAIRSRTVHTSFVQNLPGAVTHYQKYLPLMPLALEQLDLRGYDLVISSESGPAKGVLAAPDAVHLCYCHSPMRYLWDHFHDYRDAAGPIAKFAMPFLFHRMRNWDVTSAARVDSFVANSHFIKRRIRRYWGREANVVHPPIPVAEYLTQETPEDFYLWVGQMTRYKRADIAVDAFNRLKLPLVMIGDGELEAELKRRAGPNIQFRKKLSFAELKLAYARCKALIFTAEEDFGIVPVEANASGRPVIGFGKAGILDSIVAEKTGIFFETQETLALIDAVERFENWQKHFDPKEARTNAARFAPENFDSGILQELGKAAG